MSSSNTTQQDSPQEMAKPSPSDMGTEASPTSSGAVPQDGSLPSRSNEREEKSATTKLPSSPPLLGTAASPSSPSRSMTLWRRFKVLGMYLWLLLVAKPLYRWQNKPKKILVYPHRKLLTPCVPVTKFGGTDTIYLEKLAHIMVNSLQSQKWGSRLGLAANQIGIKYRMAIVLGRLVINPEWQPSKAPPNQVLEGCYSLGHMQVFKVPRADYGWAKWQDTQGNWHEEKLRGVKAIVFQHELDHLNGRTCHEAGEQVEAPESIKQQMQQQHDEHERVQEPVA